MKKMQIFEPAMCCSTGLCGVGVDPELLRISTVLNKLEKREIVIDRFNLNNAPQEFVTNARINEYINTQGVEGLPVTILDGEIVITRRYPTNEEFTNLLELPMDYFSENPKASEDCACTDGSCCSGENCC